MSWNAVKNSRADPSALGSSGIHSKYKKDGGRGGCRYVSDEDDSWSVYCAKEMLTRFVSLQPENARLWQRRCGKLWRLQARCSRRPSARFNGRGTLASF